MSATNSHTSYGTVTKTLHWVTALLILTLFPLGIIAERMPYDTGAALAAKAQVFSVHKTLGVLVFFVALIRLVWTATQDKPGLLNGEKRGEAFLAEAIHGLLYLSLVLVPLSGWLHHAATEGFAPILWPLGQSFPFVPKSEAVAGFFGAWHFVLTKVLMLSLGLHIAGALKHAVVDRDGTLRRMWFGRPIAARPPMALHSHGPKLASVVLFAAALSGASIFALGGRAGHEEASAPDVATLASVQSDWQVEDGSLTFSVVQLGSVVDGSFSDWTAAISFDETPVAGKHGSVEVTVAIGSLTLGSVTGQALGVDFFDAAGFPTAVFAADILPAEAGYVAEGTLTLKGITRPLSLPFALELEGERATMTGSASLQRLDFAVGTKHPDESSVGFGVDIAVALTASRSAKTPTN